MADPLYQDQFSEPEGRPAGRFQRRSVAGQSKIPNSLDWAIWRLLTSERLNVTMRELAEDRSYQDLRDAPEALDVLTDAEEKARPPARQG